MIAEWMITEHEVCDIYVKEGKTRNEAWMAIANEAQKKLLKYQIANFHISDAVTRYLESMQKQLEENNG